MLDFRLELPRLPTGIAQRQDCPVRPGALGDRAEYVDRGGQRDAVIDRQGRVVDEVIGRVEDEAPARFDRAALQDADRLGALRQPDRFLRRDHLKLDQKLREAHLRRRLIDDDSHRAVLGMGAEIDHGPRKAVVGHARHGDEHLPVEETRHAP